MMVNDQQKHQNQDKISDINDNDDDNESINFRYEHFRYETFSNFIRMNSLEISSNNDRRNNNYNHNNSNNADDTNNESETPSFSDHSDDWDHRRIVREENFKSKIIEPSPSSVNYDNNLLNDNCNNNNKISKFKLKKFSFFNSNRKKSNTAATSATPATTSVTNTIDLNSFFKKISCLKRVYSMVDIHNNNNNNNLEKLNFKNKKFLTYDGSFDTNKTRTDCANIQFISSSSSSSSSSSLSSSLKKSKTVPTFHIEEVVLSSSTLKSVENNNPVITGNSQENETNSNSIINSSSYPLSFSSKTIDTEKKTENFNDYLQNTQKYSSRPSSSSSSFIIPIEQCELDRTNQQKQESTQQSNQYISEVSNNKFDRKMLANRANANYFESNSNSNSASSTPGNVQRENQPSYVNISRVNHGYVPYNRYSSEYRRDDSLLRHAHDEVDRFSSLPSDSKGFLHRKVQSLYGETFADDWKEKVHRAKKGPSLENDQTDHRSTSPANQIETTLAGSKLFQKIKSIDNSDLIDIPSDPNLDKDWWWREHQPGAANHQHKNGGGNISSGGPSKDGRQFLIILQEHRSKIRNKIQLGEKWLSNPNGIPEDCIGKIRAAIGKANLLLDKKFQQFQKLCEDSINQGDREEYRIKNDDLQGFWDMVMIQVNDVQQTFEHLIKLKQNQWKPLPKTINMDQQQTMAKFSPSRRTFDNNNLNINNNNSSNTNNTNNNTKNTATFSSPRDEERQRRLMEIKRKGKTSIMNNINKEQDQEITIFAPTNS